MFDLVAIIDFLFFLFSSELSKILQLFSNEQVIPIKEQTSSNICYDLMFWCFIFLKDLLNFSLKDLHGIWDDIAEASMCRQEIIADLEETFMKIEQDRYKRVRLLC